MLTEDLDAALARPGTPLIEHRLRLLGIEAELIAKPSFWARLGRRGIAVGALVLLLAGGGATAATAGPAVWDWLTAKPDATTSVTMPSGTVCQIAYTVQSDDSLANGDPAGAKRAGQKILRSLDLSKLPLKSAEHFLDSRGELDEYSSADQRDQAILGYAVSNAVTVGLREKGFFSGVMLLGEARCR